MPPLSLSERYRLLQQAAQSLTQLGTTTEGEIIVGPQGWLMLQSALDPGSERFWSKVYRAENGKYGPDAPCWPRGGATSTGGYAVVSWRGRTESAHRVAWRLLHGRPLAREERLRRLCSTPCCVNVDNHYLLMALTPDISDNLAALAEAQGEEHYCRNGHSLKPGQPRNNCAGCRQERRVARAARQRKDYELDALVRWGQRD